MSSALITRRLARNGIAPAQFLIAVCVITFFALIALLSPVLVGDDPFGNALPQVVIGKTVQGRDLVIRKYRAGEDLRASHILFISASEKKRLPQLLASLHGSNVLTVADVDGFLEEGGMIRLYSEGDRVRFAINVDATMMAKLKVSSKLLSLAHVAGNNGKKSGS